MALSSSGNSSMKYQTITNPTRFLDQRTEWKFSLLHHIARSGTQTTGWDLMSTFRGTTVEKANLYKSSLLLSNLTEVEPFMGQRWYTDAYIREPDGALVMVMVTGANLFHNEPPQTPPIGSDTWSDFLAFLRHSTASHPSAFKAIVGNLPIKSATYKPSLLLGTGTEVKPYMGQHWYTEAYIREPDGAIVTVTVTGANLFHDEPPQTPPIGSDTWSDFLAFLRHSTASHPSAFKAIVGNLPIKSATFLVLIALL
eukprot:CAMPEP_0196824904 /NCGR_PEP_ID=MMETSP1362-20130617/92751_1 /TAXON_ID=163516 /ORGANISM="Leptocylindrus danicus, Strain CCMP1856" /LENGTH=253 /DNA_ID=CAMNT_0042205263 /DNA_START=639 /DNA_END=1402 /DNA_ORIENTATION=-